MNGGAATPVWIVPDDRLQENGGDIAVLGQSAVPIAGAVVSATQQAALNAATNPSGSNPFATLSVVVDYAIPPNAVLVESGAAGDYSTLSAALAAITDATANNRRLVVMRGTVTETVQVVAKDYVDVVFAEGALLNLNSTVLAQAGALFGSVDTVWSATSSRKSEIRRTGTGGNSNLVLSMTGTDSTKLVTLHGLVIRSMTHATAFNYGATLKNSRVYDCAFYGAGNNTPAGASPRENARAYNCDFYGGDTTASGGGGGNLSVGLYFHTSASDNYFENCRGFGGNSGTGVEAYGIYGFSYAGQNAPILKGCIGYGGTASNYTDGINLHKSAAAHLIDCVGISGINGNGVTVVGQPDNYARYLLENCTGICRATDGAALNRHGLGLYEAARDRVVGGTFIGSPFIVDSCGLYLNQSSALSGGASGDVSKAEFHGVTFIGGGAGRGGQVETTQQTGCQAARIVESDVGVRFSNCAFVGNKASVAIQVDATATLGNLQFFGGVAYSANPASNPAINSAGVWMSAAIHNMVLPGGISGNITPATGTLLGTNIVP